MLTKLLFRDVRFYPLIWVLSILGVAVGVGGWIGMQLATERASSAFTNSVRSTVGEATHVIENRAGSLREELYFLLARQTDLTLTPLIEDFAQVSRAGEGSGSAGASSDTFLVKVVGIDPVTYPRVQSSNWSSASTDWPLDRFISGDPMVIVHDSLFPGMGVGDTLTLTIRDTQRLYRIGRVLSGNSTGERTVYMDIGRLQVDFSRKGELSNVLVATDRRLPDLSSYLSSNEVVTPVGRNNRTTQSLIAAFQWNLQALAFMALFVGTFLVYTSMLLYSHRQQQTFSLLRTLGMTTGDVSWLAAGSLLGLGVTGALLGLVLGTAMGVPLSDMITGTVDRLYTPLFSTGDVSGIPLYVVGFAMGVGVSILGGALPLIRNRRVPPRQWSRQLDVDEGNGGLYRVVMWTGGFCLAGTVILVGFTRESLLAGFAACFLLSLGGACLTVLLLPLLVRVPFPGLWERFAVRNLNRYGTRIAVVLASLVVAFSLVLAVSIMIASFRTTVGGWVERLFQADFYVKTAPEGLEQAGPDLDPEFARQVRQIPGVQAATPLLRYHTVTPEGDRLTLRGIETGVWRNHSPFRFLRVTRDAWQRFRRDGVFLSEPGSYRMDKHLGDTLLLPVPGGGLRASPIVGIFNDYTTFWALVYLDYTRMRELYPSARIQDLAIFVGEGVDPGNVEPRVRRLVDERRYILRANHQLRAIALDNFDRTFAVTHMMQLIASVIAVVGLMVLLMAFNRTRRRLFGLLVATGTSRGQVVRLVLEEAGLLSLMALAGSIPTGLGLGYLLIHVVNRRSFGWLIEFDVGGYVFLQLLMLVAGSFVLGLLFPVYDIYRRSLPSLLREEEA